MIRARKDGMDMTTRVAEVDRSLCVGCGCCVKVCPRGAIAVWKGKYAYVNAESCVGCGLCGRACPADVITVRREGADL